MLLMILSSEGPIQSRVIVSGALQSDTSACQGAHELNENVKQAAIAAGEDGAGTAQVFPRLT